MQVQLIRSTNNNLTPAVSWHTQWPSMHSPFKLLHIGISHVCKKMQSQITTNRPISAPSHQSMFSLQTLQVIVTFDVSTSPVQIFQSPSTFLKSDSVVSGDRRSQLQPDWSLSDLHMIMSKYLIKFGARGIKETRHILGRPSVLNATAFNLNDAQVWWRKR